MWLNQGGKTLDRLSREGLEHFNRWWKGYLTWALPTAP